jgi:dephospho-CoA kinase
MKVIGLTGSIASGKSTVAAFLREKGATVIDADEIAKEVVATGKPAYQKIVEHFGADILRPDRSIDRSKLGKIVFKDPEKLSLLNSIVHPEVMADVEAKLESYAKSAPDSVIVLDIPLLIEVGFHKRGDLTIVVSADKDIRLKRLMDKGLPQSEAEARIAAQSDKDRLESEADIVLNNNSTLKDLREKVEDIWQRINMN